MDMFIIKLTFVTIAKTSGGNIVVDGVVDGVDGTAKVILTI